MRWHNGKDWSREERGKLGGRKENFLDRYQRARVLRYSTGRLGDASLYCESTLGLLEKSL